MVLILLLACADPVASRPDVSPPNGIRLTAALTEVSQCGGKSPEIRWQGLPPETGSIALTLIEPSPQGPWVHWMAWDIHPDQTGLEASILPTHAPPIQGIGSNNAVGYSAPCPEGEARYELRVFALGAPLGLPPTTSWQALGVAIQAHTLAWGQLIFEVSGADN